MAFGADGLNRGAAHSGVRGGKLEEAAHRRDATISAVDFKHRALPHHIVDDDQRTAPRQSDRPLEIAWRAGLVGIDEDQIERRFRGKRR